MSRGATAAALAALTACASGSITTDEGTFEPQAAGLVQGGVQSCPVPDDPGFEVQDLGDSWQFADDYHLPGWDIRFGARGLVAADFDDDGWVDVILPQTHERARVLRGSATGALVPGEPPTLDVIGAVGGSAADVDGDGDLDVVLYGQADPRRTLPPGVVEPPVLLWNRGDATFEVEVHPEWEPDLLGCGGSASWADVDLDGDLDLYLGRLGRIVDGVYQACPSRFLRNDGNGGLVDASDTLPAAAQGIRVMASGFHAFDDDPEPELYLVADAEFENNPGGAEVPVAGNLLLDWTGDAWEVRPTPALELELAGMGLGAADLNDDGRIDVAVPDVGAIPTLVSGSGAEGPYWTDVADSVGLVPDAARGQVVAWGGEFADVDNDGRLDLAVPYGAIVGSGSFRQPDELYRDTGERFEPLGADWGYDDDRPNRGVIAADVTGNGAIDLLTREVGGHLMLHRAPCRAGAWLTVDLDQPGSNPDAVGAKVIVLADGARQVRWVGAGSTSFASGGPPTVHLGLADHEQVDAIVVIWPDGEGQAWRGVPTRQRLTIHRQGRGP